MRIVLDTNVLVSGVISAGGLPRRLLDAAMSGGFQLCTSEPLLAELLDVLTRTKFAARLAQAGLTPEGVVSDLRLFALVAAVPPVPPRLVPNDPDDDHVIAAAIASAADLIATGDKRDLLTLGRCQGIEIVTARTAFERVFGAAVTAKEGPDC